MQIYLPHHDHCADRCLIHLSYLFWSDWGESPRIERSELDGSGRRAVITTNVVWPNGLTVDKPSARLYWADAKQEVGFLSVDELYLLNPYHLSCK